jgi:sugar lactone lactonase YvrE
MKSRRIAGILAVTVSLVVSLVVGAFALRSVGAQSQSSSSLARGPFQFEPLPASAPCTPGGNPAQPLLLPSGYTQTVIASEPQYPDVPDQQTLNETGPHAGRFFYRTHETNSNGAVSVTDLETGETRVLAQRADWERLDGIAWTPWGTILFAEETAPAALKDPAVPQAQAGLVYELDPATGVAVPRPAIGSRSHEGLRFDPQGNLYGISESNPGYIYRFTPDRRGDLSSGQLYALKVVAPTGGRTGEAVWVPLDRATVQVDSHVAAAAVGATGYNRPEDVEIATSTGNNQGGANTLYVAVTGRPTDNRVLAIDLREPQGGAGHATAVVSDYVKVGLNAPTDFEMPDNGALDKNGNLYMTEDPATAPTTGRGDDIWVAVPGQQNAPAEQVVRFASLTDCDAEPTGIYFDQGGRTLYVDMQHRGGDHLDKTVAITPVQP